MTTASNFTGIARAKSGRGPPMAQWKCSRVHSISTVCSLKQNLEAETSRTRTLEKLSSPPLFYTAERVQLLIDASSRYQVRSIERPLLAGGFYLYSTEKRSKGPPAGFEFG